MDPLTIFIVLALIAAIASLLIGLGSMSRGGQFDEEHSGGYMRARVVAQAIAAFFILVALVSKWMGL